MLMIHNPIWQTKDVEYHWKVSWGPYFFIVMTMICQLAYTQTNFYYMHIMFSHKNLEFIYQKLDKELESCSRWFLDKKVYVHFGKTECIFVAKSKI